LTVSDVYYRTIVEVANTNTCVATILAVGGLESNNLLLAEVDVIKRFSPYDRHFCNVQWKKGLFIKSKLGGHLSKLLCRSWALKLAYLPTHE
jgi:hypothetical protein